VNAITGATREDSDAGASGGFPKRSGQRRARRTQGREQEIARGRETGERATAVRGPCQEYHPGRVSGDPAGRADKSPASTESFPSLARPYCSGGGLPQSRPPAAGLDGHLPPVESSQGQGGSRHDQGRWPQGTQRVRLSIVRTNQLPDMPRECAPLTMETVRFETPRAIQSPQPRPTPGPGSPGLGNRQPRRLRVRAGPVDLRPRPFNCGTLPIL